MKKIILLIISLFLISGCSVKYDLDLTGSEAFEKMQVLENNSTNEYFSTLKNFSGYVEAYVNHQEPDVYTYNPDLEYYNFNDNSTAENVDFTLDYNFPKDQFKEGNIINTCYETIYFNEGETLNISTSSKFLCFEKYISLDDVQINIKTDKLISEHNADKVTGNVYTWNITRNNANNKPIILNSTKASSTEVPENNTKLSLIIISITVFAFLILIIILFKYKNRKYE